MECDPWKIIRESREEVAREVHELISEALKQERYDMEKDQVNDAVHHPSHYTFGGIECIDAIEAALGRDQFIGFLRGQVLKYQWRLGRKDSAKQDNDKAIWYANKLATVLEK